jgi:hypothetical protein
MDAMPRAVLIHWKPAEAGERVAALEDAGWEVEVAAPEGAPGLRAFREHPPEAFVIDLSRLPSHGRAVGLELRRQKATRTAALVFAGGAPEKVAQTRALLPDAGFADWSGIGAALTEAMAHPAAAPVVPITSMAGYSGTPLVKKLGIRAGTTVLLAGAPKGFETLLAGLPEDVVLLRGGRALARTALLFARSCEELERRFPKVSRRVEEGGGLWIVWPKKTSALAGDLAEPAVREFGLLAGWVDYKICAVDETWSGLLFARREVA